MPGPIIGNYGSSLRADNDDGATPAPVYGPPEPIPTFTAWPRLTVALGQYLPRRLQQVHAAAKMIREVGAGGR